MTLLKATAMYAASLGLSVLAFWLDPRVGSPLYLVFGFVMTRFVMGGLIQWHPNYNTVHNVFTAKFKMFLLWPLQMPLLLVKLIFNSVM